MIEAEFKAVVPKVINAEFEAIIPREKSLPVVNKELFVDTNGKYEVKADDGTVMTKVDVEVEVINNPWNADVVFNNEKTWGIRNIEQITIHEGVTTLGIGAFEGFQNVKEITLPESLETINSRMCYGCYNLKSINIPSNIAQYPDNCFYNCSALVLDYIPPQTTTIRTGCFQNCRSIKKFVFPQGVIAVNTAAFNGCRASLYDFRAVLVVPTLSDINAFGNIVVSYNIVVPDALYDDWIVATNWATYASRIVKASEWVEPTNE